MKILPLNKTGSLEGARFVYVNGVHERVLVEVNGNGTFSGSYPWCGSIDDQLKFAEEYRYKCS